MLLEGGCHCGQLRYRAQVEDPKLIECNCSICTKKGALHLRLEPAKVEFLKGKNNLTSYRFGTKKARHLFCSTCGIAVYGHSRIAPELITLNARSLDQFHELCADWPKVPFDGKNWEEAVAKIEAAQ